MSRVGRADIHIHTTMSDGQGTPLEVARVLARSGLSVAAVTDHDTVAGALRVREALAGRGPEVIVGTEVTTADGHVLALFVDRDLPRGLSARDTVALVHDRGGLAIAAHPFFPIHSVGDLAVRLPFDAVEVANGTPLGELANRRAARRLGPAAPAVTGGSDAHRLAAIGHVRTHFPGHTAADFRLAIERGETWAVFDWNTHLAVSPAQLLTMAWRAVRGRAGAPRPGSRVEKPAA